MCPRPDFPRDEAGSGVVISSAVCSSDRCQGKPRAVTVGLDLLGALQGCAPCGEAIIWSSVFQQQHVGHTLFRKEGTDQSLRPQAYPDTCQMSEMLTRSLRRSPPHREESGRGTIAECLKGTRLVSSVLQRSNS